MWHIWKAIFHSKTQHPFHRTANKKKLWNWVDTKNVAERIRTWKRYRLKAQHKINTKTVKKGKWTKKTELQRVEFCLVWNNNYDHESQPEGVKNREVEGGEKADTMCVQITEFLLRGEREFWRMEIDHVIWGRSRVQLSQWQEPHASISICKRSKEPRMRWTNQWSILSKRWWRLGT